MGESGRGEWGVQVPGNVYTDVMSVNLLEIAVQSGVIALLLGLIGLYVRYKYIPRLKTELRQGVGLAIGAWMKGLSEEAEKEGVGGSTPGMLKLGGFEIEVGTIKALLALAPQALQLAKTFGLTGTGGGGGGGKIGL